MNPPKVTFELKKANLLVVGLGVRSNLQEMNEAASGIHRKMDKTWCYFLLVDYRDRRSMFTPGAFNIVKRYDVAQPGLTKVTIAAVFSDAELNSESFGKRSDRKRVLQL